MPQQFPGLLLNSDVDRPLTLVLPPVLLEQVLANLILNAAQAGAKMLWIDAVRDAGGVKIVLRDNGGGIAGAQLAQAFQPFVTSRQEGMGLGLVICQRLVRYVRGNKHGKSNGARWTTRCHRGTDIHGTRSAERQWR